jgi:hypothetical protein
VAVKPIFRSAITDAQGEVDVGYLALIWGLVGWGAAVGVSLVIAVFAAWRTPDKAAEILQSLGISVGAVSGGFATMLGAVGLFRMGDKERPPAIGSTTTTTMETKVEAGGGGGPLPVVVSNPDPVPVIETKKKVAAKQPRRRRR